MIKTAYIVEKDNEASVQIENTIMKTFDNPEKAAFWAFSLGYRVYRRSPLAGKVFWVKYTPSYVKN
ncbi:MULTISPECIES: hypothetical protein [Klebsiella]|uniref:hypothetical protein n=1 Tax=Klebsiella TaxID=570 RepID=UPI0012BA302F|nr:MULTISPECIES: hypothetical protein [Klebsiella]MDZ0575032.1 hypothetical protein [Klebsiella variicola]HBR0978848.1 hypothetical protein [Klebsiella variicola]